MLRSVAAYTAYLERINLAEYRGRTGRIVVLIQSNPITIDESVGLHTRREDVLDGSSFIGDIVIDSERYLCPELQS